MGPESGQQARPNAGNPIQSGRGAEQTPGLAIRHDLLGERETDPGKARQLGGAGLVGVDPLGRAERPAQRPDAVPMGRG
jgi:hypothetical protein